MHDVKFGLFLPTGDFAAAKHAALRAESDGFYSVSKAIKMTEVYK